jgi:pimeloyl-ACP methyl ester carboxylesterase
MFENMKFDTPTNPLGEYLTDAFQRTVLYWDVMRQRGNQYMEHQEETVPHVLDFEFEPVLSGRTLPQPVNYGLVRIVPPKGVVVDDNQRPFVIIDPRAGHGPGIGGFKPDSEIGMAMRAGHTCYFIGFLPMPEPGQTIEAIVQAEAVFLERVSELHPKAAGKPVVIGNCQAGWAAMILAALNPDLCGPLILAGSPLSYWAGVRGVNPMRYSGGLLGGSWLTALTGDLGNGKFDGAWLIENFEKQNPANTLWSKQYNLYKNVDTEASRYLGFERWWGGHVVLNAEEMQYIVDNLFVGNKLSTTQMTTADGTRIDLKKIRNPIICFCSKGDNVTPPQQALGWITDLYSSVDEIRAAGQTIVYTVHETVGHLGIFVAGSVAKKEHREFTSNIDLIDCLPPGLYEAVLEKKTPDATNVDLVETDYISRFEARTLEDIRAMGGNTPEEERCFAAARRLSDVNLGLYRKLLQPLVRALSNEPKAEWARRTHSLRLGFEMLSDRNPAMAPLENLAQWVREHRQPVKEDNLFLKGQEAVSDGIRRSLDAYRQWSEKKSEKLFFTIYDHAWLQRLLGLPAGDDPLALKPGQDPDLSARVEQRIEELRAAMDQGGAREAVIRSIIYIRIPDQSIDERGFEMLQRIRKSYASALDIVAFKQLVREQFFMVVIDEDRAMQTLPALLKGRSKKDKKEMLELIRKIVTAKGSLDKSLEKRLDVVVDRFGLGKAK